MTSPIIPAPFRRDLKLYPGPKEPDGSPTFNLYEPLKAKYFKLSWEESVIYKLAKEGMTYKDISDSIKTHSTADISPEEVESFYRQAAGLGLLNISLSGDELNRRHQREQSSWLYWFLMHYLYFRVPLFHPNSFLQRTLPYLKWIWSPGMVLFYLAAALAGGLMVVTRFDQYLSTYTYFFTFEGFLAMLVTISLVKIFHELAHAYTAQNYGVQVPAMGIAFMVLWPVLYTDVTDSWRLKKRSERLAISIAGVVAELVIAGIALFGWVISPPGLLKSLFFMVSSVTLISSLFINLNPILRFDGYYILCDLWGIDNLRPRAFAVGRWKMREWLFGLELRCPEEQMSRSDLGWLCFYSYASWIYLVFLYTIIALFVYHHFTKAVGIILFFLEIAVFFIWPVAWEIKELYKLRRHFHANMRLLLTSLAVFALFIWFVFPLSRHVSFPAVIVPVEEQVVYVPASAVIEEIFVQRGEKLQPGAPLIALRRPELEMNIALAKEEINTLEKKIQILKMNKKLEALLPQKEAELASQVLELNGLLYLSDQMSLKANFKGTLYDWDETLKTKQPVAHNQILGKIADISKCNVIAYVPEKFINTISVGDKATFGLPASQERFKGRVASIQRLATAFLEYPALASLYQGPLAVRKNEEGKLLLSDSYFEVYIALEETEDKSLPPFGKAGDLYMTMPPQSLFLELMQYLYSLFIRESSL